MSTRTLALIALLGSALVACKRSAGPVPEGQFVGTVPLSVVRRSGATHIDTELRLVFDKENGKDVLAFALSLDGGQCVGEVRAVNNTLVADALRCTDPYVPACVITTMPFVLERQDDGSLRSRVFVTSMADALVCGDRAGTRSEYAPGVFRATPR